MASSLGNSEAPSLTSPISGLPSFWRFSISFFKLAMSFGLCWKKHYELLEPSTSNTFLPNLHKNNSVDSVEHVQNASHWRRLNVDWRQSRGQLSIRVNVVHLLLEHNSLLGQMSETLWRLLCFVVSLAKLKNEFTVCFYLKWTVSSHLLLINCISFLFTVQRWTEVSHTALCACDEMIADGNLQWLWTVVLDVQGESVFEETQRELVFTDCMKYQTDVALKTKGIIIDTSHQCQFFNLHPSMQCLDDFHHKLESPDSGHDTKASMLLRSECWRSNKAPSENIP